MLLLGVLEERKRGNDRSIKTHTFRARIKIRRGLRVVVEDGRTIYVHKGNIYEVELLIWEGPRQGVVELRTIAL